MGGTTGVDVSGVASNSADTDVDGNFSITNGSPSPGPGGGIVATGAAEEGAVDSTNTGSNTMQIAGFINALLGISPAYAQKVQTLVAGGRVVGTITFSGEGVPPGTSLGLMLLGFGRGSGAGITPFGLIGGPGFKGQIFSPQMMPTTNKSVINAFIFIDDLEMTDLDSSVISVGFQGSGVPGGSMTLGMIPPHKLAHWSGLTTGTPGQNVPLLWPGVRSWNPVGPNDSMGRPLVNGTQTENAFSGKPAYLLEDLVFGPVNPKTNRITIWNTRTGRCVLPRAGVPGLGWTVGPSAGYGPGFFLISGNAEGCLVFSDGVESIDVIDPYTGALFAPTAQLWGEGFIGSQMWRLLPSEVPYAYQGQLPSPSWPGLGAGITGVFGKSNLIIDNAFFWSDGTLATYNANPANQGSTEGPDSEVEG